MNDCAVVLRAIVLVLSLCRLCAGCSRLPQAPLLYLFSDFGIRQIYAADFLYESTTYERTRVGLGEWTRAVV